MALKEKAVLSPYNTGNNHTSLEKCILIVFYIFVLQAVM